MELKFRSALDSDCDEVADMINVAYRSDGAAAGWTTEAHLLGGVRTRGTELRVLIAKPDTSLLLAFRGDSELVGCVLLEKRSEITCYLGMLTVHPRAQALGVGQVLLGEAEIFASEQFQTSLMEMTVITLRHELLAWYERRGYRRTGRCIPFPVNAAFGELKVPSIELEILDKILV